MITLRSFSPRDLAIALAPPNMNRADLALDGPMFDSDGSQYLLIDRRMGIHRESQCPSCGLTISVKSGAPYAAAGARPLLGADVAVQLYPALVSQGRNVASGTRDTSAEWRAGLAIMNDGSLAFAVGQMPMRQFAKELIQAGAVFAGYTDGGSSTSLLTKSGRYGHPDPREVPTWLIARGAFVPPLIAVGLAAAAGGYYVWRTRRRG